MTSTEVRTISIEDIRRLNLHPGETIVVTMPFDDPKSILQIQEWFGYQLEVWHPGTHVLVLPSGTKCEVLSPTEEKP